MFLCFLWETQILEKNKRISSCRWAPNTEVCKFIESDLELFYLFFRLNGFGWCYIGFVIYVVHFAGKLILKFLFVSGGMGRKILI